MSQSSLSSEAFLIEVESLRDLASRVSLNPLLVARHFWYKTKLWKSFLSWKRGSQSSLSSEAFLISAGDTLLMQVTKSQSSLSSEAFLICRNGPPCWRATPARLNPLLVARHFWYDNYEVVSEAEYLRSQSSLSSEAFLMNDNTAGFFMLV